MGIKIFIQADDLPLKYQSYKLIKTVDGISDSVYLLDDKFVLKIFENTNEAMINNEQSLLQTIHKLQVPYIVDVFTLNTKNCIVYSQIQGSSLTNIKIKHIKQIALFLKQFHHKTINQLSSNIELFKQKRLYDMIVHSLNPLLLEYFNKINLELKNDGIIHGDIFLDNVKFQNDVLSGVYDFSEACNGDFLFDLAVIAQSWCFDDNHINSKKVYILINTYDSNIDYEVFKEYIKYSLLYYATTRYINGNNYTILLDKLKGII